MRSEGRRAGLLAGCGICGVLVGSLTLVAMARDVRAEGSKHRRDYGARSENCDEYTGVSELGGSWYWMRSPDEEKRHVIGLYNRYCIRCHGVDGRGVWDIPDVPNFTNVRWQACRTDGQLARIILEGRGACMPPFRGAISLEESWALARYLRTFVPGTEIARPDLSQPEKPMKPADPVKPVK